MKKIVFVLCLMYVSFCFGRYMTPITEQEYIKEIQVVALKVCDLRLEKERLKCGYGLFDKSKKYTPKTCTAKKIQK